VYRIAFDEAMAGVMGLLGVELDGLVEQGFLTVRSEDGRWTLHPLMARLVRNAAKENGRETGAHERAIAFFDSHRQTWTGNLEDCRSQFESFYHYCELGRYGDADQVMDTCVDVLDRQGHSRSLLPIYEQLTKAWQPANEAETQNLGWAWTQLGNTYRTLGRYQDAIAAHEQAQQFFQSIAFRQGEANSLGNLGNAYDSLGQYQKAIDFHQQYYDIAREIGDRHGEATSPNNLGIAYDALGQHERAIEFYQQSLEIYQEIGDRQGEAIPLNNLGGAYDALGQHERAIEFYQQSLEIKREIGYRQGEAASLHNLGSAYDALGQHERAIEFYQQSLETQQEIGDRGGEATSLGNLGVTYRSLGQNQRAIDFYQQSLEINREIGDREGEAISLANMAYSLAKLDRRWEARQHYEQALQIFVALQLDHRVEQCKNSLYSLGQIIPAQVIRAPQIRDESDAPTRPRKRWKTPWWGWFLVGVAIALAIAWWLKK